MLDCESVDGRPSEGDGVPTAAPDGCRSDSGLGSRRHAGVAGSHNGTEAPPICEDQHRDQGSGASSRYWWSRTRSAKACADAARDHNRRRG
jgi:hypothetical protein